MPALRHRRLLLKLVALAFIQVTVLGLISVARATLGEGPPHRRLHGLAPYLAGEVASVREDSTALREKLVRMEQQLGARVALYGPDGNLHVAGPSGAPAPPHVPPPPRAFRPQGPPPLLEATLSSAVHGTENLVVQLPPPPRAAGPDAWAFLASFALVFAVAALFARELALPLERLASAARALGAGELSTRSGLQRKDELGEVAAAFDEMAARVEQLVKSQRTLLVDVGHELRTPLARVQVALELAEEGDGSAARQSLVDVKEDLAELRQLVDEVLATARLDAGSSGVPPLKPGRVELDPLLAALSLRFRARHPQPLSVEMAPGLPPLSADPVLLRRALFNLLDNAGKYSEATQPIQLRCIPDKGGVAFVVADRGVGISAEDLPRVFDPFFRADASRSRATGGVGLGLSLGKRIAELHGGTLTAQAQPGAGATFTLWLPGERTD